MRLKKGDKVQCIEFGEEDKQIGEVVYISKGTGENVQVLFGGICNWYYADDLVLVKEEEETNPMENYSSWVGKRVRTQNLKENNAHSVKNGEEGIIVNISPPWGGKERLAVKLDGREQAVIFYADRFSLIESFNCPRCGGELVEKMSIGLNEMVKKCKECGWC